MTTLEDIFTPIERNSWIYYAFDDYCNDTIIVYPIQIGFRDRISKSNYKNEFKTLKENLSIKHYIKIGEECSICYEEINKKNNAYLTDCGHCFHMNCINKWITKTWLNGRCPICRKDIGDSDIYQRYNNKRLLDSLEDFWINIDNIIPEMCNDLNHFKGMNKYCNHCLLYRKIMSKKKYYLLADIRPIVGFRAIDLLTYINS